MAPHAVILDFNGTISDDEPLLFRLFRDVLAERGVELSEEDYFGELSGLSDPEIAGRALAAPGGEADPGHVEEVLREKIARYRQEVERAPTVSEDAAGFVRELARRVPVAIASGAAREEVELVLGLAGLRDLFGGSIVCIEDVDSGKPDPAGYLLALARLNEDRGLHHSIVARDVLAIEDSVAGVQAARAAGLRCAVVAGDDRAERAAHFVIERLDVSAAEALFER